MGDRSELLHRKLMNTIMTHYRRGSGRASDGYQWARRRDSSTSAAVARVTASRQHWQTHTHSSSALTKARPACFLKCAGWTLDNPWNIVNVMFFVVLHQYCTHLCARAVVSTAVCAVCVLVSLSYLYSGKVCLSLKANKDIIVKWGLQWHNMRLMLCKGYVCGGEG